MSSWALEQERLTQKARLQIANPEAVYRELQQISQKTPSELRFRDDKVELALLERNEPLINLALACYGTNEDVFKAPYNFAVETPLDAADAAYRRGLRIGCLSNSSLRPARILMHFPKNLIGEAEIHHLLTNGEHAEIEALLCNPSLSTKILEELYEHTGACATIPDERWCQLVHVSRKNERIGIEKDRHDSPDMDHYRIHKALFRLLEIAPLEAYWLRVLYGLLDELNFRQVASPESIDNVLARWAQLDDRGIRDNPMEGYFTSLSLEDEFRCLVASLYGRTYSGGKSSVSGSPTDTDIARRCAYYGNANLTAKEIQAGYKRDKEVFVFAAINNNNLISNGSLRKTFEEEMVGGDLTRRYLRNFKLKKKEWPHIETSLSDEFLEETATNKEDARIERLQTTLTGVERQLTVMGQKLQNLQQLVIVAAIGLAVSLYFRH